MAGDGRGTFVSLTSKMKVEKNFVGCCVVDCGPQLVVDERLVVCGRK